MSVSHVIPLLTPTGDFRFGVVKGELGKKCMSGQEDGCLFGLLMQAESVCVCVTLALDNNMNGDSSPDDKKQESDKEKPAEEASTGDNSR